MRKWLSKNLNSVIIGSFLIPILLVAFVSISHVTTFYNLANPFSWAVYLSIAVEIAALAALAGVSAKFGKFIYIPFGIVTFIQLIGNFFFSYTWIDINSKEFKDWVDMVDPLVSYLGVESGDMIGHKRFLALFAGGMLPLISLSFLHMLVKFEEEEKGKAKQIVPEDLDIDKLSLEAGKREFISEQEKYTPTEEDLIKLQEELDKLRKQKFPTIEEPSVTPTEPLKEEDIQIETQEKKVLSYTNRNA